ncbi:MAG: lamin tail domain-containing protein [Lewinella sp.]
MARLFVIYLFAGLLSVSLPAQRLVISEFIADPTPSQGLPQTEYIELYNSGSTPIALEAIHVASGGRAASAGINGSLEPDSYLVLVPEESLVEWRALGIPVAGMDLPGLTNTGDVITLIVEGDTLVELYYRDDWYRVDGRDKGGFSLEYNGIGPIDCPGSWAATRSDEGGTPGMENSIHGRLLDTLPPSVERVELDENGFLVVLTEIPAEEVPLTVLLDGNLLTLRGTGREYYYELSLDKGLVYNLLVLPGYRDCSGNEARDTFTLDLLLPEPIGARDLLINEILFDPVPGGGDYVEVYNNSASTIQLQGISLDNTLAAGAPKHIEAASLIRPGEFVVLTSDRNHVQQFFPGADLSAVIETDLPSLPNERGNMTLLATDGTVLDAFDYTADMHDELLNPTEGVSLERLDTGQPTQDRSNWYSAASTVGFGTPTRPNSQREGIDSHGPLEFYLENDTFDPHGTGIPQRLELSYRSSQPGWQATVRVYDAGGHLVRTMTRVALLARSGSLFWDGADDSGRLQSVGPYILLIEAFTPTGQRERHKLVGILAG